MCLKANMLYSEKYEAHDSNAEEVSRLKNDIPRFPGNSLRPEQSACATDFAIPLKYYFTETELLQGFSRIETF